MSYRTCSLLPALGLVALAGMPARAQEPLLASDSLEALGYIKYWETSIDLRRARAVTGVHVIDDTVYVITDGGDVHAIHASAGLPRWAQNIADAVYAIYRPTHFTAADEREMAVFTTSPRTLIVDRYLGDIVADMPLDRATSGSAVVAGERIYFGSADGHFYAMTWSDPRTKSAVFSWRVRAGGPVVGTPVLVSNADDVIFAAQSGSVYCCTTAAKIFNWEARTNGPITTDFVVEGPGVYVASADRSLYRFDALSGAQRWRARFPEPLDTPPVVSGGIVFQYCLGSGVTALDAESGEVLWQVGDALRFVCRGVDDVILDTGRGRLLKVDAVKGDIRAAVPFSSVALPATNPRDNTLYVASHTGVVLCAKPAGTPYLTSQQLSEARRIIHQPPAPEQEAEAVQPPRRRAPEPGVIDPDDPLRSPSDRGADDDSR